MSSQAAVGLNCALTMIVYRIRRTNELQREKLEGGTKNPTPQVSKFINVSPENLKKTKTFTTFFHNERDQFPISK